jgi:hypothetical protein
MHAPRRRHSDTDDEGVQPAALQGYQLAIFGGTKALSVDRRFAMASQAVAGIGFPGDDELR